jgi:hypothetical protein
MQDPCIQSVMVQLGDAEWTSKAIHMACTVARANACGLTFVKLVSAGQPGWLGTDYGRWNFSTADQEQLRECTMTAEDYGVLSSAVLYQYMILSDAIFDAAQHFNAHLTFATLPHYRLPMWRRFLMWRVHRQFEAQGRLLNTLERPAILEEWMSLSAITSFIPAEKTR